MFQNNSLYFLQGNHMGLEAMEVAATTTPVTTEPSQDTQPAVQVLILPLQAKLHLGKNVWTSFFKRYFFCKVKIHEVRKLSQ